MIFSWPLLVFIAIGTIVIIVFTLRQKHTDPHPSASATIVESPGYNHVVEQLTHQRSLTAVLREGISALANCHNKTLVIDSDLNARVLYRIHFRHDKLSAFFYATTCAEAAKLLDSIKFELVIIDPRLSDADGSQLINDHVFSGQRVPCIVVTSSLSAEFRQQLLSCEIPILSKPVDFPTLRVQIKAAIEKGGGRT